MVQYPISDPLQHANGTYGQGWQAAETISPWSPWMTHYTTGQFSTVAGISYHNHCGPTAITNLICTLARRQGQDLDPGTVFHQTARFGVRHLYFINSVSRLFYGTSDLRAGSYLRRMCRKILRLRPGVRLHRPTQQHLKTALAQGHLVYLMLLRHPVYRSHHLLCCGLQVLERQGQRRIYLQLADGHNAAPRFLELGTFHGLCWEVSLK